MSAAAYASPQITHMLMAEERLHFESSAPMLPSLRAVNTSALDKAATLHTMPSIWQRVLRNRGAGEELRVTILGCSVSAGCGADDGDPLQCVMEHSWGRRLQAWLQGFPGTHFQVQVWARRAVGPEFFETCTSRFVRGAHVVVLEFEAVLQVQATGARGCSGATRNLVAAVRRAAPEAAIVFLGWPNGERDSRSCEAELRTLVADGVDVVLAGSLRPVLGQKPYAKDGHAVHPNTAAADLLAQPIARLLARRTLGARCGADSAAPDLSLAAAKTTDAEEWCTEDIRALPTTRTDGWRLVNEGGTLGRSAKLGYLSTSAATASPLTINVSSLLPKVTCGYLTGSLLFEQSWRPDRGTFAVRCKGSCEPCAALSGSWARGSDAFPVVNTFVPSLGATLTHAVRFHLFMGFSSGTAGVCLLEIEHMRSTRQNQTETRVRIDGLSFSVADCSTVCYSLLRPITRSTVQHKYGHFGRRCAVGQGDGTFGHVGPACLRDARTSDEGVRKCSAGRSHYGRRLL